MATFEIKDLGKKKHVKMVGLGDYFQIDDELYVVCVGWVTNEEYFLISITDGCKFPEYGFNFYRTSVETALRSLEDSYSTSCEIRHIERDKIHLVLNISE